MPCIKTKNRFHYCGHDDEDQFTPCNDHTGDEVPEATKRECWKGQGKKKRNAQTTINTTMKNGGVCCRDCDAEFSCEFIKSDDVFRNAENNLVHRGGDTEHEFCDLCATSNFTKTI